MTLPELASRLGLKSVGSLRAQVLRGALQAEKVGRDWIVTDAEAARYERENRGRRGFANESHPLHGKQGPGHRRKKTDG
jgi:hypothetical protein